VRAFLVPGAEMVRPDPSNPLTTTPTRRIHQRGQAARLACEHDLHRRSDRGGDLLAGPGPALWNRVFGALPARNGLDITDNARVFVVENMAAADGAIGCGHSKYYWSFWRPAPTSRRR
jgi:hypothetical protein